MGRVDLGIFSLRHLLLRRLDVVRVLPYSPPYAAGPVCVAPGKRDERLGVGRFWAPCRDHCLNHSGGSRGRAVHDWMGLLPASATGEELAGPRWHCRARPVYHHRSLVGS